MWLAPALILSCIVSFFYTGIYIGTFNTHLRVSITTGVLAALLGLIAAVISIQLPWMRLGRWKLWWLNALVCATLAGLCAIGASGVVFTLLRSDPVKAPSAAVIAAANGILGFGIAFSAGWGAIFGTWFSLRLDKYFVESI